MSSVIKRMEILRQNKTIPISLRYLRTEVWYCLNVIERVPLRYTRYRTHSSFPIIVGAACFQPVTTPLSRNRILHPYVRVPSLAEFRNVLATIGARDGGEEGGGGRTARALSRIYIRNVASNDAWDRGAESWRISVPVDLRSSPLRLSLIFYLGEQWPSIVRIQRLPKV